MRAASVYATLDAYRDVFRGRVLTHNGRIVDMAGDSVLAVFDSVVEAVEGTAEARAEIGAFGAKTA